MKKINLILAALLVLAACKKDNNGASVNLSSGSIILAPQQPIYDKNYTVQDTVIIAGLMSTNNLPTSGFVFYAYQSYTALDQNNQMGFFQLATGMQVRNGLPVFFYDLTFPFENGKFNEPYPSPPWIAGNITLDNKPNLTLQALRDTFIKTDNACEAHSISIGDSTLIAQLGYYNLNIGKLPDGGTPNYIRAWYVQPQHSTKPEGYFRDDTGAAISFQPLTFNGPPPP